MAVQFVFEGRVTDGAKPVIDDVTRYRKALETLAGKRVEFVLRKPASKRSIDQNAYWWAVPVKLLAEHCGYTDAQMHYALLGECFGFTPGPNGTPVPVKPSSSDLSVEEFKHLIDWVLVWAPSEMGVAIPEPAEWSAR
jgi:hypothetical protein